jgi:quercetin dioxygenase-like cupin family protein
MKHYEWDKVAKEQMNPLLSRQAIHTANMTVARVYLAKGAIVPSHFHVNEQVSVVLQGKLRFTINGQEQVVAGGEVVEIPPNAPHLVEALEDSVVMDLFTPVRSDWIRGDDAYLRK